MAIGIGGASVREPVNHAMRHIVLHMEGDKQRII